MSKKTGQRFMIFGGLTLGAILVVTSLIMGSPKPLMLGMPGIGVFLTGYFLFKRAK